jgi:hypothetical protein
LPDPVTKAINDADLVVCAVLSGNRNFEGRVNPLTRANYLASPMLVVVYALAGSMKIDITKDPIGIGKGGKPVFLKDIWPSADEIRTTMAACLKPELFKTRYASVFEGDEEWRELSVPGGDRFAWNTDSTDFIALPNGPQPVSFDKAHPYVPNGIGQQPTYRIADLSNPILKPWAVERMRDANEEVLKGKAAFTAKSACWPGGVPAVLLRRFEPVFFIQTPKEVWMFWQFDHQVRRIYMNQPHSAHPTPSWYGESIGHYDGGELVVDTIGLNDKSFVDNYRTPHTERLHVVERFKQMRDEIHEEVCRKGYDAERNTFTQYYGSKQLDAALLLMQESLSPAGYESARTGETVVVPFRQQRAEHRHAGAHPAGEPARRAAAVRPRIARAGAEPVPGLVPGAAPIPRPSRVVGCAAASMVASQTAPTASRSQTRRPPATCPSPPTSASVCACA